MTLEGLERHAMALAATCPPSAAIAFKRMQKHAIALAAHPWCMPWPWLCAHAGLPWPRQHAREHVMALAACLCYLPWPK